MKILVTGANGFVGKNLCMALSQNPNFDVLKIVRSTSLSSLYKLLDEADIIVHLAAVNRPDSEREFEEVNVDFTSKITSYLIDSGRNIPIILSSSIQVGLDNPYGISKSKCEEIIKQYSDITGSKYFIYRLPNLFGKWCRPNYNSFIATFCHNIANNLSISINDPSSKVRLIYIDDLCKEIINVIVSDRPSGFYNVDPEYVLTVGEVADLLYSFRSLRSDLIIDSVGTGFKRALYSTYISYLDVHDFKYKIPSYSDPRGCFSEMLKTKVSGQFSFFTAYPGITRGGHYHHTKTEKFLVIKGKARFRFKNIIDDRVHEIFTSGDVPEVVESVPGWAHDITNIGDEELICMLWANEIFDRSNPDTYSYPTI